MLRRQPPVRRKAQDERLFKAGPGVGPLPQADAVREQLAGDRRVVRIIRPAALRRGPEAVPAVNPPALLRLQPVGQILRLAVKQIGLPRAAQMYDSDAEIQRGGSLRPAVRQPDQIAELCVHSVFDLHRRSFLKRERQRRSLFVCFIDAGTRP